LVGVALDLALHLAFDAILSDGWWRGRALQLALDAVLSYLAAGRRFALDLAFDEAILSYLAVSVVVTVVDDVFAHLSALLDVFVVRAVHEAHFRLVAVFLEGVVWDLVALYCGVAASAVGTRLPLAVPVALPENGRHGSRAGGGGGGRVVE
jgi:hypothetical protein